jgi:hypothetical protein
VFRDTNRSLTNTFTFYHGLVVLDFPSEWSEESGVFGMYLYAILREQEAIIAPYFCEEASHSTIVTSF